MRNRSWIIILLIVWIGQWAVSTGGPLPTPSEPGWEGCLLVENLTYLVTCQAKHRYFWSISHAYAGGTGRRCRRRRRKRRRRRWRVVLRAARGGTPAAAALSAGAPASPAETVFAASRWGVAPDMSQALPERLYAFWQRYAACFKTQTRDTSAYAYHYLSGVLRRRRIATTPTSDGRRVWRGRTSSTSCPTRRGRPRHR